MSSVDKHNAVITYLQNCPEIAKYPLFFNFAEKQDNNQMFVTFADRIEYVQKYIDGSRDMQYTFTMVIYKSVAYNPLVEGMSDENHDELLDVQSIIDWIDEQNDNYVFPDFGEDCVINSITPLTSVPMQDRTESDMQPALAQYSLGVRISYLDTSKVLWNS